MSQRSKHNTYIFRLSDVLASYISVLSSNKTAAHGRHLPLPPEIRTKNQNFLENLKSVA